MLFNIIFIHQRRRTSESLPTGISSNEGIVEGTRRAAGSDREQSRTNTKRLGLVGSENEAHIGGVRIIE